MTVFWFRRDLRIDDNHGFFEALSNNDAILPIFIFDPKILNQLPKDDARISYIHQLLNDINTKLKAYNKSIAVFFDNPLTVFEKLNSENNLKSIYCNHDYEPYAIDRDATISDWSLKNNIRFLSFKDQVIFEKNEIVKSDKTPYLVFTPYSKEWKKNFKSDCLTNYNSQPYIKNIVTHNYPFLELNEIGFVPSYLKVSQYNSSDNLIENYENTRNFPSIEGTSLLAPHLRFGAVSIRKIVAKAIESQNQTFLNELIWREFFMQILWHFPHTCKSSFRPKYDAIKWNNNEVEFKKWCEGKTGYPIVDAGMRELNATGHMHNRVRMIVASFLCKHLLIDWRWGETYFASKLLDYEQSSNVGNWQWAAGSGVDAAPYFRIFNPTEQVKKFDKDLIYIKKWVPELQDFTYPQPIVDHVFARERCLRVFKEAVG